jgi:hypothetical protein
MLCFRDRSTVFGALPLFLRYKTLNFGRFSGIMLRHAVDLAQHMILLAYSAPAPF